MKKLSVLVCLLLGSVLPGWTQQPGNASTPAPCCDALEQHMRAMEDRIILLEGQVRLLKEQLAQAQATGAAPGAAASDSVPDKTTSAEARLSRWEGLVPSRRATGNWSMRNPASRSAPENG